MGWRYFRGKASLGLARFRLRPTSGVEALAFACLEPPDIIPAGNSVCFAAPKQVTHCRSHLQVANSGAFWQIRDVPFFHNERDGAVDPQGFRSLWSFREGSPGGIAVGIPVARHPPHRSVREDTTSYGSYLGSNDKPSLGRGSIRFRATLARLLLVARSSAQRFSRRCVRERCAPTRPPLGRTPSLHKLLQLNVFVRSLHRCRVGGGAPWR